MKGIIIKMKKITHDEYYEKQNEIAIDFLKSASSEDRHGLVATWNWDNGIDVLKWIADDKETDKATILMMYWMSQGPYFKKYEKREDVPTWQLNEYDFLQKLEERLTSGFYQNNHFSYNPANDDQGYNWTNEYDQSILDNLSEDLLTEIVGGKTPDIKHCYTWIEGLPEHVYSQLRDYEIEG